MKAVKQIPISDIALILLFVSFLASGGIFVRESLIGPINTALFRILFSVPLLAPVVIYGEKNKKYNKLSRGELIFLGLAGAFLAGDLILWNISFSYTTIANANLFSNLVPLFIIPFSYFIYKENISRIFFIGFFIIFVGVILLIFGKNKITSFNLFGDILAFLTAAFYAAFLLCVYKMRERANPVQIMYYSAYGSILVLLLVCLITEGLQMPTSWQALAPLLGLTIFSQILGQGGLSYALGRVPASVASVLVLTQPAIAGLYAFFIYGENLTHLEIVAMFIVLCGIYFVKKS